MANDTATVRVVPSLKSILTSFGRDGAARGRYLKDRSRFVNELRSAGLFPPSAMLDTSPNEELQLWATAQLELPHVVQRLKRWRDNGKKWNEIVGTLKRVRKLEEENKVPFHVRAVLRCRRDSETKFLEKAHEHLLRREESLKASRGFRTTLSKVLEDAP